MRCLYQTGEFVGGNDGNILPVCAANDEDLMIVRYAIEDGVERLPQSGV